jgi:hypothetical protein
MDPETRPRLMELCEQASKEKDSAKLFALVQEINRLLEAQEETRRVRRRLSRNPDAD